MSAGWRSLGLILAALLALTSCGGGAGDRRARLTPKIINGDDVAEAGVPQLVQVALEYVNGTTGLCSGTIIGPTSILTAAHCLLGDIVETSVQRAGRVIPVQAIHFAPTFRVDNTLQAIFDDVAVLETAPHGLPALPLLVSGPVAPGSEMTVYGYGRDENGGFGILKAGQTQAAIVTPNHIVSPPYSGSGIDPCNGDSGGPAVQTWPLPDGAQAAGIVAITSTGTADGCGAGDVTYYVNLSSPSVLAFITGSAPGVALQ
jgi:secreted trypsin-like serine protease